MRADSRSQDIFLCLALASAVFAVYANIYGNAFVFDDESLIVGNRLLREWHYLPTLFATPLTAGYNMAEGYYRPLQAVLYLLVFKCSGLSLFGFHLLNVALHAVNACLVFTLGRKLRFDIKASFAAALLWALHPIQTEAVTYMSATADVLAAFFCLAGMIYLLPDFSSRRIWLSIPIMVLALLSKETAIIFPLLVMSGLFLVREQRFVLRTYACVWPLFMTAIIYAAVHTSLLFVTSPSLTPDLLSAPAVHRVSSDMPLAIVALPVYARLLLWPVNLRFGHDFSAGSVDNLFVIGSLCLILAGTVQVLRRQNEGSLPLSWGLLWFAAAYAPVFLVKGIVYEHWLYLPSAGLFLGAAEAFVRRAEKSPRYNIIRPASTALSVTIVILLGLATWNQNAVWHDPVSFYNRIIAGHEHGLAEARAHANLGELYASQGDYDKAIEQDRASIADSGDTLAAAHSNLAVTLLMMPADEHRAQEAFAEFSRAIAIDPEWYPALDGLADYYAARGDMSGAANYRTQADKIRQKSHTLSAQNSVTN